jgi:hypothetical protein
MVARHLDALNQHCATLTATDTEARHATPGIVPLQHFQQVQHDACATGTHRVTDCNCAAIDIQALFIDGGKG